MRILLFFFTVASLNAGTGYADLGRALDEVRTLKAAVDEIPLSLARAGIDTSTPIATRRSLKKRQAVLDDAICRATRLEQALFHVDLLFLQLAMDPPTPSRDQMAQLRFRLVTDLDRQYQARVAAPSGAERRRLVGSIAMTSRLIHWVDIETGEENSRAATEKTEDKVRLHNIRVAVRASAVRAAGLTRQLTFARAVVMQALRQL
jgi:hypothetical protein